MNALVVNLPNQLAQRLTLPTSSGNIEIQGPNIRPQFQDLGSLLSGVFEVVILIAAFLMLSWVFWGVYQYIFGSASKDQLDKARQRIMWAIIGFVITVLAFTISQYVKEISKTETFQNTIPSITPPK